MHVRRVYVSFSAMLVDNRRMLVLLRSLGARSTAHPDGPQLVRAVFELADVALGRPMQAPAWSAPALAATAG
ncbi:hypothetical protein [Paucibacter soli]|uniref:hypothetical protein n=1 Tax=Paucibacter soli TaxID=3133433 RepID=UPI0030A8EA41